MYLVAILTDQLIIPDRMRGIFDNIRRHTLMTNVTGIDLGFLLLHRILIMVNFVTVATGNISDLVFTAKPVVPLVIFMATQTHAVL